MNRFSRLIVSKIPIALGCALFSLAVFAGGQGSLPNEGLDPSKIRLPSAPTAFQALGVSDKIVANKGSYSYSYKLPIKKWRRFPFEPAITYSSSRGRGFLGYGFALNTPFFERSLEDGVPTSGSHLLNTNYGKIVSIGDSLYRPFNASSAALVEIESEELITERSGDGYTHLYGGSKSSILVNDSGPIKWCISSSKDAFGNKVVYHYRDDASPCLLSKIEYVEGSGVVAQSIQFTYAPRKRPVTDYRYGVAITMDRLLSSLTFFSYSPQSGELTRTAKVELSYDVSNEPLLTKIARLGAGDEDDNKVPSVQFNYSDVAEIKSDAQTQPLNWGTHLPKSKSANFKLADFNRDGLVDVLAPTNWSAPFDWRIWYNRSAAGTNEFEAVKMPPSYERLDFATYNRIFDSDSNIAMDLLQMSGDKVSMSLNTFLDDGLQSWDLKKTLEVKGLNLIRNAANTNWVDVEGDGRSDFFDTRSDDWRILFPQFGDGYVRYQARSTIPSDSISGVFKSGVSFSDLNGDGLVDLYSIRTSGDDSSIKVAYNKGKAADNYYGDHLASPAEFIVHGLQKSDYQHAFFADINSNGIKELITYKGERITVFARSAGEYRKSATYNACAEAGGLLNVSVGDMNGNGSHDLVFMCANIRNSMFIDFYKTKAVYRPYLVTEITQETGTAHRISYRSSNQLRLKDSSDQSKTMPYVTALVSQVDKFGTVLQDNGSVVPSLLGRTLYSYKEPSFDFDRKSFIGFDHVTIDRLSEAGSHDKGIRISERYYAPKGVDFSLLTYREKLSKETKTVLYSMTNRVEVKSVAVDKLVYPLTMEKTEKRFEIGNAVGIAAGSSIVQRFSYDFDRDFGTIIKKAETVYNGASEAVKTEHKKYQMPSRTSWGVKLLSEVTVADPSGIQLRGDKFYYLPNSSYVSATQKYTSDGWQDLDQYSYDEVGNIVELRDGEGRIKYLKYLPGLSSPTEVSQNSISANGEGVEHVRKLSYNHEGGQIVGFTEVNGQQRDYHYDGLGRLTKEYNNGALERSMTYRWGTPSSFTEVVINNASHIKPSIRYFDSFGQQIAEQVPSEEGYVIKGFNRKNLLGQIASESESYQVSEKGLYEGINTDQQQRFTSYIRDSAGRTMSINRVGRMPLTIERGLNYIITHSSTNGASVSYYDDLGRVCAKEDWSSLIQDQAKKTALILGRLCGKVANKVNTFDNRVLRTDYSYDPLGNLIKISVQGLPDKTFSYDKLGRKISASVSGVSTTTWRYDKTDNVLEKSRASGTNVLSSMIFSYDGLGRISETSEVAMVNGRRVTTPLYSYRYDRLNNRDSSVSGIGKIVELKIKGADIITYGYDPRGNPVKEVLEIPGFKTFTTSYSYDSFDRIERIVYPDKGAVSYGYSRNNGQVKLVNGDDFDAQLKFSGMMQLAEISSGSYRYRIEHDMVSQLVGKITAEFDGKKLIANKYSYEPMNGYISQVDSFRVGGKPMAQRFGYDGQGRLSSISDGGRDLKRTEIKYNGSGDITSLLGSEHSYLRNKYGRIDEITAGANRYHFDDIGRIAAMKGIDSVSYDSMSRVTAINGSVANKKYHYRPDNSIYRIDRETAAGSSSNIVINKYSSYNSATGQFTNSIIVGNRTIAKRVGSQPYANLVLDHIGTLLFEVDGEGKVIRTYDVNAFGSIENGSSLAGHSARIFAGNIYDGDYDLHIMGSRFYSPKIGRFLTPDEFVAENPKNCVQSPKECNVFSYAQNNPLHFVDPSGQFINPFKFLNNLVNTEALSLLADSTSHVLGELNNRFNQFVTFTREFMFTCHRADDCVTKFTTSIFTSGVGYIWGATNILAGNVENVSTYRGAVILDFKDNYALGSSLGVTIGNVISLGSDIKGDSRDDMIRHEYGHFYQSMILGPVYLPIVGTISPLSLKINGSDGHERMFLETWATQLGGAGHPSIDHLE